MPFPGLIWIYSAPVNGLVRFFQFLQELVVVLGGKLTVWSELDSGTEVELSIPAANAYATPDGRRRSWLAEKFAGKLVEKYTERKS